MAIPLRPEAGTWISPAAGIALGYRRLEYYNHYRYHESLGNLTLADVYARRDRAIIERSRKIKNLTIRKRRLDHQKQAA